MRANMGSAETLDAYIRRRLRPYLEHASQGAVAASAGIRQQQVSDYKTGQWKNPPLDVLDRLARAFGFTLAGLLAEMPTTDERPAWQRRLYAAVASIATEADAEPVLWVTRRLGDAPTDGASASPRRAGQTAPTAPVTRKRRATTT